MTDSAPNHHPSIYLLCDHLDASLAMGEDLLTEKIALAEAEQKLNMPRLVQQAGEVRDFLYSVRTLELSLIARLLQARKRAEELKHTEPRIKPLIILFIGGTEPLVRAATELGDTSTQVFETGNVALAFLRSRGLIARDTAGLDGMAQLAVTEDYLVAERIRLGTLLNLVATFLDMLDAVYDLYKEPEQSVATAVPAEAQETASAAEPVGQTP